MRRILFVVLCVFVSFLCGIWLVWHLVFESARPDDTTILVANLSAPAEISWTPGDAVAIRATNRADAYAALGFVDGSSRTWQILFMRQVALGRMGEWFGSRSSELDRLTRQLGIPFGAIQGYQALSPDQRRLLDAYANGVNAALDLKAVQRNEALILSDIVPDPWLPWHTIAVERLFAWLSTNVSDGCAHCPNDSVAMERFHSADRALRTWLRLYGFENSIAWTVAADDAVFLVHRQVYGAAEVSPFRYVTLDIDGENTLKGVMLSGLPVFTFGKSRDHAWALFLRSKAQFSHVSFDRALLHGRKERVQNESGDEQIVSILRIGSGMPIFYDESMSLEPDSVWVLNWSGFSVYSDWSVWTGNLSGSKQPFRLFSGDGIEVRDGKQITVTGSPTSVARYSHGTVIGNTPWTPWIAKRVQTLVTSTFDGHSIQPLLDDDMSAWAESVVPAIIDRIEQDPFNTDVGSEALSYLKNWNFRYTESSIPAAIIETIFSRHGTLSDPQQVLEFSKSDSVDWARDLDESIRLLSDSLGPDLSQWRWEVVRPDRRYFAPFARGDASLPDGGLRFAPITRPGRGHPSTLSWGDNRAIPDLPAPAAWEVWAHMNPDSLVHFRQDSFVFDRFLGRYLIPESRPPFITSTPPVDGSVTLLKPRSQ